MSVTGSSRNTEHTRQAILEAAADLLTRKGAGVTITEVAACASVSKSGLLHHFPSREALLLDVLRETQRSLREQVYANLDLSENTPGKLLRAYVRTLCEGESHLIDLLSGLSFWTGLEDVPGVELLDEEDNRWWHEHLGADGLDPVTVRIVRRAAEGLAGARAFGDESPAAVREAGEELIRLTLRDQLT